ncbi:DUF1992 domain-containing protein [Paenibacillus sp. N1-5-1-14]|uniref:DUF1992 domain-containing protein n=1 Tax=Paenibacillus radicibacter TaxID=2972488 RepID=UPI0021593DE3|nr:DUF1992 domain-containing protein [Paenibacillus radicibacter]MCR8642532.1 DUF1992 domain-containing protein [Paenibacillus radicibacter]
MFFKSEEKKSGMKSEVREDAAQTILHERRTGDVMSQIFADFEKNGGYESLSAKGRPLDIKSHDPLGSVLANANVLPAWLTIQHEIRDQIQVVMNQMESGESDELIDKGIIEINIRIRKYNTLVPIPSMQRNVVARDSIVLQYPKWI